jgi:hypothetical protein
MALIVLCVVIFLFVLYAVLHEMCDSYVSTLLVTILDYLPLCLQLVETFLRSVISSETLAY